MRAIVLIVLALVTAAPIALLPAAQSTPPAEFYVGATPAGALGHYVYDGTRFTDQQYCVGPATLQVNRNAAGTWDVLVRFGALVASPSSIPPQAKDVEDLPNDAGGCAFRSATAFVYTNLTGSPAQGFTRTTAYEYLEVAPFAWGGPGAFYHYRSFPVTGGQFVAHESVYVGAML